MEKQKIDYNRLMENQIVQFSNDSNDNKPTLLLHACCAPCSSAVLERLSNFFDITIFYYNPNIHPQAEYERRRDELKSFISNFPPAENISLIIDSYNPEEFFSATNVNNEPELKTEGERGERCRRCYQFRMKKAFEYAYQNGFDYMTTTLSISPHKDAEKINTIGIDLEQTLKNFSDSQKKIPAYLFSDFKKKNGFKRSLEISAEYNLYRQDYCGCVFSC